MFLKSREGVFQEDGRGQQYHKILRGQGMKGGFGLANDMIGVKPDHRVKE